MTTYNALSKYVRFFKLGKIRKPRLSKEELKKPHKPSPGHEDPNLLNHPLFSKKIKFQKAASLISQLPPQDSSTIEIAFAGRSNVGKSSILNALFNTTLVKTSPKPGETQTLNFFGFIDETSFKFVDLPGYGFAFAKKEAVDQWNEVVSHYITNRTALRRIFLLVDSRHGLKEKDRELLQTLRHSKVKCQVVMTKADLLFPEKLTRSALKVTEEIQKSAVSVISPTIIVSSKEQTGITWLQNEILMAIGRRPLQKVTNLIEKLDAKVEKKLTRKQRQSNSKATKFQNASKGEIKSLLRKNDEKPLSLTPRVIPKSTAVKMSTKNSEIRVTNKTKKQRFSK